MLLGMGHCMAADETTTVEVHERGFEGEVIIGGRGDNVRISGTRPQDGSNVIKEIPADRDAELADLAKSVVDGDEGAASRLLAHLGVLDPPLPESE